MLWSEATRLSNDVQEVALAFVSSWARSASPPNSDRSVDSRAPARARRVPNRTRRGSATCFGAAPRRRRLCHDTPPLFSHLFSFLAISLATVQLLIPPLTASTLVPSPTLLVKHPLRGQHFLSAALPAPSLSIPGATQPPATPRLTIFKHFYKHCERQHSLLLVALTASDQH